MRYSEKFREKMVAKMTGPSRQSATSLSKESNVPQATLSRWLAQAKVGVMSSRKGGRRKRWTAEDKIRIVREAAVAGDEALGALLRREGLHEADLARFRDEVEEAALEGLRAKGRSKRGESPEQKRVRQLEKELKRKEKALAEAAALLVLRGKVQAFLAADEEGDTNGSDEK